MTWKSLRIAGYDTDDYEMNSEGQLRSIKFNTIKKWSINKTTGYYNLSMFNTTLLQHRLIALLFITNPDNLPCVDHKDGNILNNTIDNLRWCTRSQNSCNRKHWGTSGYKNIYKDTTRGSNFWCVDIRLNGKRVFRKHFKREDEQDPPQIVINCRNEMLRIHHGDFSRI